MKTLKYEVDLNASKELVWKTMLKPESYKKWIKGFSPNSQYSGEWKQGATIRFFDPDMGGTEAVLDIVDPYNRIPVRHTGLLSKELVVDNSNEFADKWIGTTEEYLYDESEGETKLTIIMEVDEAFEQMLSNGWRKLLDLLRELINSR